MTKCRQGGSSKHVYRRPNVYRRFGSLCFLTLIVPLVSSACGVTSARVMPASPTRAATPAPTVTPAPTPTLTPPRRLAWQAHQPPIAAGPAGQNFGAGFAFTQSDGNTAYLCIVISGTSPGHAQVWATHDRAAHWARVSDVVSAGPIQTCYLVMDDLQPTTVVAVLCAKVEFTYCSGPANYLTRDGGVTWTLVSGTLPHFAQLATLNGVTYALTRTPPHSHCSDCAEALSISRDGMRSWTQMGPSLQVSQFWLKPDTGELLAATTSGYATGSLLWTSADSGQHWTAAQDPSVIGYLVQAPTPGLPWHACGITVRATSAQPAPASILQCSADGGRTWTNSGGPYIDPSVGFPLAIADDGSVLAQWHISGTQDAWELRRLPPGATTWQSLGPLPPVGGAVFAGTLIYVAGTAGGVLWTNPLPYNTYGDPQGRLYTTSYP